MKLFFFFWGGGGGGVLRGRNSVHSQWNLGHLFPILKKKIPNLKKNED